MNNITTPLYDRALEKKIDTIESLNDKMAKLAPVSIEEIKLIVDKFCEFSPPVELASSGTSFHLIHSFNPGGIGGAKSIKPGNILFNWKKLFTLSASSTFSTLSASAHPYLIPLAALMIWIHLWSQMNIKLSERHAALIWSLWTNCRDNLSMKVEDLLEALNENFARYDRPNVKSTELLSLIDDLEKIRCLKVRQNVIWLTENVRLDYK